MVLAASLFVLCLGAVLFFAVLALPRWCTRSLHRHRLWRLRDRIADDILDGVLPREHPAVMDLLDRTETVLAHHGELTLLNTYLLSHLFGRVPESARRYITQCGQELSTGGLTAEQAQKVRDYRQERLVLLTGSVLTGSWLGIFTLMLAMPKLLIDQIKRDGRTDGALALGRAVTDEVAASSRLGRAAGKAVRDSRFPGSPLLPA